MSDNPQISQRSDGPTPDALGLKLSGSTSLDLDLRRTQEVEITLRGVVVGHIFEDQYDKNGNVALTIKHAKVKIDELVEILVLSIPRRMPGQTQMPVDADAEEEHDGDEREVIDAEVIGELPPGDSPPGVNPQTGEVEESGEPDDFDRDPLIPEDAWRQLNREQKDEVVEIVARIRRLGESHAQAGNPTDRKVAADRIKKLVEQLGEEFGIALLDPETIEDPAANDEPPPPPVLDSTGPVSVATLKKRKAYLKAQTALPADANDARTEEIAEIDRRLAAQENDAA